MQLRQKDQDRRKGLRGCSWFEPDGERVEDERQVPYFSDYKMHFPPQIWEETGVGGVRVIVQMQPTRL